MFCMQNIMSQSKRQHWIPRFYLKNFAERKEGNKFIVSILRKKDGVVKPVSINDVAVGEHFYSPRISGERDYRFEENLARLEERLAPDLEEVLAQRLRIHDEGCRWVLSGLIANLWLRNPESREFSRDMHKFLLKKIHTRPKDAAGNPVCFSIELDGLIYGFNPEDWSEPENVDEEVEKHEANRFIERNMIRTMKFFMKKKWHMKVASQPAFITSDRPVVLSHSSGRSFEFTTPGTIIQLALSPTMLLVLHDDLPVQNYSYDIAERRLIDHTNSLSLFHARHYMITSIDPEIVFDQIKKYQDSHREQNSKTEL